MRKREISLLAYVPLPTPGAPSNTTLRNFICKHSRVAWCVCHSVCQNSTQDDIIRHNTT
jgi:hypothetical protein